MEAKDKKISKKNKENKKRGRKDGNEGGGKGGEKLEVENDDDGNNDDYDIGDVKVRRRNILPRVGS